MTVDRLPPRIRTTRPTASTPSSTTSTTTSPSPSPSTTTATTNPTPSVAVQATRASAATSGVDRTARTPTDAARTSTTPGTGGATPALKPVAVAEATTTELASAHTTAAALRQAPDARVQALGGAVEQALARVEKAVAVEVPMRLKVATGTASRAPSSIPGVLKQHGDRVTFHPADEAWMPFDLDAASVAHLPRNVPVIASATKKSRTIEADDGTTSKAQVFTIKGEAGKPRARFVGMIDLVDGTPHVRDLAPPPRMQRLPDVDPRTGAAWREGAIVDVEIGPHGAQVRSELAPAGSAKSRTFAVIEQQGLDPSFSASCLKETAAIEKHKGLDDKSLVDLTHEPFFAIDNPGSRDIDQAMRLERTPDGGMLVSYALADASHYIRPGMALFDEAMQRGASYYLPGVSVPMLPSELSDGVISLNAHEDHRALVLRIKLDADGNTTGTEVLRAKIHSQAQLTYENVSAHLEAGTPLRKDEHGHKVSADVVAQLALFREVGDKRIALAKKRGVVEPERFDMQIGLNGDRFELRDKKAHLASKLNAEISILANVAGATASMTSKIPGIEVPGIYRLHPPPDPAQKEALRRQLAYIIGANQLPSSWAWDPSESLSQYVDRLKQLPANPREVALSQILQGATVRINSPSEYARTPGRHSGLEVEPYGRFTAPMREQVGVVSHAVLFAKDTLERAHDAAGLSNDDSRLLWDLLLLDALVPPGKLSEARQAQLRVASSLASSLTSDGAAGVQRVRDLVTQLRNSPVHGEERKLVEASMDRAMQAGNGSRMKQRQVDTAGLRLLFDDLFRSDLGGVASGNANAPVRFGTVTGVTPGRVLIQLRDPDVEVKLSLDDLRRGDKSVRYMLDHEGAMLRRTDGAQGPGCELIVGHPVRVQATHHDGERLHFSVVD